MLTWLARLVFRRAPEQSRADPDGYHAQTEQGVMLASAGDFDGAIACFGRALALRPELPAAHFNFAAACKQARKLDDALASLERALERDPEFADAHLLMANIALERSDADRAEPHLRAAIALRPQLAEAHADLGLALFAQGRFDEAEASCREALRLKPDLVGARVNLGLVLEHGRGDLESAVGCFREALRLQPEHVDALANLATACQEQGLLDEAAAGFARASQLAPQNPIVHVAQGALALLRGDFGAGWPKYEWRRRQAGEIHRRFAFPVWDGSSLAGRTILLYAEQGIGDQIMFASCIPEVIATAGHCVIECSVKLGELFRRSFPAATVHAGTEDDPSKWLSEAPPIDLQLPIGSLPLFLRRSSANFPRHAGYLHADAEKVRAWRGRLDALGAGIKVGLSWRGGMPMSGRTRRSIDLERLLPLLRTEGAHFVDLQYTDCSEESTLLERRYGVRLVRWAQAIDDYDETAALVCALDLTLSVCTALVHLGGALGRPVWVLAPFSPEWRYGFQGETMPWYPSVTMFRQPTHGDWESVIEKAARALAQLTCAQQCSG
jgi:tetratricopeptide (TPR) repeat protein